MNSREWFEGVLGYRLKRDEKNGIDYWERPDGMMVPSAFDGTFFSKGQESMIRDFQSEWIEHVVKPMREMGYEWGVFPLHDRDNKQFRMFAWCKEGHWFEAEFYDDNIFQASLDAAAQVPEVKERLDDYKKKRR